MDRRLPGQTGSAARPLPARGDSNAWSNYRSDRATNVQNSVRNNTFNNVNVNRNVNRPNGWWGGGYGSPYARGYAHGWADNSRWHNWSGFWGNPGVSSGYWWGAATMTGLTGFVLGSAMDNDNEQVVHYDYGDNIYYENNQVYRDSQPIATADAYATQAMQIASVPVPEPPAAPEVNVTADADAAAPAAEDAAMKQYAANWMPLGVFAVAKENDNSEPTQFLQMAVHKDGYIAGTYYNSIKDETLPIEGSVDKKTQRVAWHAGDNKNTVMECGLTNLTQDSAPALLHFGTEKTEQRLLVRMDEPPAAASGGQTAMVR